MHTIVQIILSFIGWFLMYLALNLLEHIHYETGCDFWYIKPKTWADNFGVTWLITLFFVFLTL